MMYTKVEFGMELKKKVLARQRVEEIGHWCYSIYSDNVGCLEPEFEDIVLTLNTMEHGPEFALTYEELEQIANNLITRKPVMIYKYFRS